jgi:hypothetical protein
MGYILTPISVDLGQVSGVIGSKNKRLISDLVKMFGGDFDQFDEMAADYADGEDDQEPLTMRAAITQMVMGEEYDEELGFMYGYALEFICLHLGEQLPNSGWSAMPRGAAYAQKADKALKRAGVAEDVLQVSQLMNRGAPVPLPLIEDFPGIGYMRAKEIEAALKEFGEDKLTAVTDEELQGSLAEVRGWLVTCAGSGRDLICFYA